MAGELNPNHPVVQQLHDNWHVVAAMILHKLGRESVEILQDDIDAFTMRGEVAIVADCRGEGLVLRLVPMAEAKRLARAEGGLPA